MALSVKELLSLDRESDRQRAADITEAQYELALRDAGNDSIQAARNLAAHHQCSFMAVNKRLEEILLRPPPRDDSFMENIGHPGAGFAGRVAAGPEDDP